MNSSLKVHLIARIGLAFVFLYHGLIPKIIWLSPVEEQLTNLHNIGIPATVLSPIAGGAEILLGLSILLLRQSLYPVYFSAVLLIVLLIDVAIFMPGLLVEAFNPVSINITAIILCYIIVITQKKDIKVC
ncbi:DoxX-like family protein [Motiliproteus sp. MSK22-1]|uniref:DoxX-like family protein n=1 Tax=Motiliproteus sp. MSK22-1 TaxID=1897630 RepID=UPI000976ECB4|nr:DoxX-like family protein [Motiliproteus sp. MSK22-1]OMH33813.1 hypothetical protein BGP75_12555 [Motiliproteus sp. MSK22-1]